MDIGEIQPGKTYHNGGKRKRTVLRVDPLWVHYVTPSSPKGQITAELINRFAKWAKGQVQS